MYENYKHLIFDVDRPWIRRDAELFAEAISMKTGGAMTTVWGFIDGTVRRICRPKKFQRIVYNGWKRLHALKYQSIVTPNGLIANLYGPIEGRRHDCALLAMSKVLDVMFEIHDGRDLAVYGDPAYPIRPNIINPFPTVGITDQQAEFNKAMSSARIAVEWVFGKIVENWGFGGLS